MNSKWYLPMGLLLAIIILSVIFMQHLKKMKVDKKESECLTTPGKEGDECNIWDSGTCWKGKIKMSGGSMLCEKPGSMIDAVIVIGIIICLIFFFMYSYKAYSS
jgi:hypothetical protein